MPKVKPLGNSDMKAQAYAKREVDAKAHQEEQLIRQLNALKELTGMQTDAAFADVIGMSDGRYRYLKRFPTQFKLGEIRLVQALAKQYNFQIDFAMEAAT